MKSAWLVVLAIFMFSVSNSCGAHTNLAAGKPVVFETRPNYALCSDSDDAVQLTDGKFAGEGFWFDKQAVGWHSGPPALFTVDLGEVKPISGAMYSTVSRGNANVLWPNNIYIFVSDDGVDYRYAGDVIELSRDIEVPKVHSTETVRFHYKTTKLKTRGRYVKFSISAVGSYIFTDEIEVYQGEDSFLTQAPKEEVIKDVKSFTQERWMKSAVTNRLQTDIDTIKRTIEKSQISKSSKNKLVNKLMTFDKAISDLPAPNPATFKTIFPFNDLQASIFGVYGELLSLQKYPRLVLWKKHRYDASALIEQPGKTKAAITIDALQNEFRSDSFLVTNAGSESITAILSIGGLKGLDQKSAIEVSCVPWTDTAQRMPVAAALPAAPETFGGYRVKLPAGLTTPIWFTVDTSKIAPGTYKGNVIISRGIDTESVPISIRVSKIAMQRPRVSLGMWDYTQVDGNRALIPENLDSAIVMMKSHYVDSPWAESGLLPLAEEFGADYFATLDKWVKRWPDARNFMFYASVGDNYLGAKINTELFNARVGKWAMAIDTYLRSIDIDPERFVVLLVDESSTDAQDEIVVAWAKAVKASGSKISLFQDQTWEDPAKAKFQEAFTIPDILCPNMMIYNLGPESAKDYWRNIRDTGHKVWFYQCTGPVRILDPSLYYREMAWHAFKAGFVGLGFWSFGDLGGGTSSWNEYVISEPCYAPAFVDPTGVTDSKHWQAVREGVQDYEYLAMLQDSIASSTNSKLKASAEKLLSSAVDSVTKDYNAEYTWQDTPAHSSLDDYRIKVIRMLEKFR